VSKSLATISPIRSTTNPFASQSPISKVNNMTLYDRNRSPDPPLRTTRGSQSPLILRKRLEAASSPIMQRR
jgi:hypothetical protein